MDILKSISKIFKLEIILLLLVVMLFVLLDKQCFNFFIERLENNETCDPKNACDQVVNLKTQLKESNDKIDSITKSTTSKINDLKQKSLNNNLINNRISALETQVNTNKRNIDDLEKSHSETKNTANSNKKDISQSKSSVKTMSKMYHS